MFGVGVGGVNLGKVVWREDGENRIEWVEKKRSFLVIFVNWVVLELKFIIWV